MQPWCYPCVMGIIASRAPPAYLMNGIGFAMVGWATCDGLALEMTNLFLSLIHISEPTRRS
eukprot:4319294-Prymnesium_polylepis.1